MAIAGRLSHVSASRLVPHHAVEVLLGTPLGVVGDVPLVLVEDMADICAAAAGRAEMQAMGEAPIPWKQLKADLGLT